MISNVFAFFYCSICDLTITAASWQKISAEERNTLLFTDWLKLTYDTLYACQNGADFRGGCGAVERCLRIRNSDHFFQYRIVGLHCARIYHSQLGCTHSSTKRLTLRVLDPRTWRLVQEGVQNNLAQWCTHHMPQRADQSLSSPVYTYAQLTCKALPELEQSCASVPFEVPLKPLSCPASQLPSRDWRSIEIVSSQSEEVLFCLDVKYTATGILNRPQTISRTTTLNTFSKVTHFSKRPSLSLTFALAIVLSSSAYVHKQPSTNARLGHQASRVIWPHASASATLRGQHCTCKSS